MSAVFYWRDEDGSFRKFRLGEWVPDSKLYGETPDSPQVWPNWTVGGQRVRVRCLFPLEADVSGRWHRAKVLDLIRHLSAGRSVMLASNEDQKLWRNVCGIYDRQLKVYGPGQDRCNAGEPLVLERKGSWIAFDGMVVTDSTIVMDKDPLPKSRWADDICSTRTKDFPLADKITVRHSTFWPNLTLSREQIGKPFLVLEGSRQYLDVEFVSDYKHRETDDILP